MVHRQVFTLFQGSIPPTVELDTATDLKAAAIRLATHNLDTRFLVNFEMEAEANNATKATIGKLCLVSAYCQYDIQLNNMVFHR